VEKLLKFFKGFGISEGGVLVIFLVAILFGLALSMPSIFSAVLSSLFGLLPLWLPVILAVFFWKAWITYVRAITQNFEKHKKIYPGQLGKNSHYINDWDIASNHILA